MDRVERFETICSEMSTLYKRKNADYGNSFSKSHEKFGPIAGIVRMSDKLERITSLLIKVTPMKVNTESIADTLTDLANYAIMLRIELEGGGAIDECTRK